MADITRRLTEPVILSLSGGALGTGGSFTPAPTEFHIVIAGFGDSRAGKGTFDAVRPGTDDVPAGIDFYVTDNFSPGTADYSYPVSVGITTDMPVQGPSGYDSHDYYSPYQGLAKTLKAIPTISGVSVSASHHAAAAIFAGAHNIGVLPSASTAYGVAKAGDLRADVAAAHPDRGIIEVIHDVSATNDVGFTATTPAQIHATQLQRCIDLRTTTGFSSAPIILTSVCPELFLTAVGREVADQASKIAALQTVNAFWHQTPPGRGSVHEGESPGTGVATVRTVGEVDWAHTMMVALGFTAPDTPTINAPVDAEVEEQSLEEVALEPALICDGYYYGVDPASPLAVRLSDPLDGLPQKLLPPIGGWPVFDTVTPANNTRAYKLLHMSNHRVLSMVDRNVVITEIVPPPVGWTLLDWESKSSVSPSATNTTAAMNTTAADFIIISISGLDSATPTISDSEGNTWTAMTRHDPAPASPFIRHYYCMTPVTDANHTFSVAGSSGYWHIIATVWSGGAQASPVDAETSTAGSVATGSLSSGAVTPSVDGCLVLAHVAMEGAGSAPAVSGSPTFTLIEGFYDAATSSYRTGLSYYVQPTAGSVNSTWTWSSGTGDSIASLTALKPA